MILPNLFSENVFIMLSVQSSEWMNEWVSASTWSGWCGGGSCWCFCFSIDCHCDHFISSIQLHPHHHPHHRRRLRLPCMSLNEGSSIRRTVMAPFLWWLVAEEAIRSQERHLSGNFHFHMIFNRLWLPMGFFSVCFWDFTRLRFVWYRQNANDHPSDASLGYFYHQNYLMIDSHSGGLSQRGQ